MALEIAKSGIRVNVVAPGPTDTGMLTRFTGTAENKAALVTGFRWVASASPRRSPTESSSSRRTKLHSSPATSSTSTADKVLTDPGEPGRARCQRESR